jgi:RNA polymerase sigma factor (sigma-70 family)
MDFETTLTRLSPRLRAISRKVDRRYSYCDKDDFMQEARLYLWLLAEKGELEGKNDSYLLQGCYYFLKNYIRKICKGVDGRSISMNAPIDDEGAVLEDVITTSTYSEVTDSVEIFLMLEEAETLFSAREKDIFYFRMEGFTTREIGEKLGISHVMVVKSGNKIKEKCCHLKEELFR